MFNNLFINFFFLKIKLESNILRKNQVKEPPKEKVQTYRISDYIGVVIWQIWCQKGDWNFGVLYFDKFLSNKKTW